MSPLLLALLALPLPGVDLTALEPAQAEALTALLATGPCPCDPALDLISCLRRETCPPAVAFAAEAVALTRGGLKGEALADAVVDIYADRFLRFRFSVEGRPSLGPSDAPIQLIVFLDHQCPHCALLAPILEDLRLRYGPRLRIIFKHYPLRFHLQAASAARAALAAHRQGRYAEVSARLFAQQADLSEGAILGVMAELGLDVPRFQQDWASEEIKAMVRQDAQEGLDALLDGTPMFYANGVRYRGPRTPQDIAQFIDKRIDGR
ncbi:thioredoxin domain-containing protein [Myxococcota bacterium]|nr:thioredoxin domain-containing protein [Myxococcota bacterium]